MFSVKTECMIESCRQLERQYHEYGQISYELENAIRKLSNLSSLEDLIQRLRAEQSEMTLQQDILWQMAKGLDMISVDYMRCENRIYDNCEQNIVHYIRMEVTSTSFEMMAGMLDKLPFYY